MKNLKLLIALCFLFALYSKCSSDARMDEIQVAQTEMTAKVARQDTTMRVNQYNMVKQINYATLMGQYGLSNLEVAHDSVTKVLNRHYGIRKIPSKESK